MFDHTFSADVVDVRLVGGEVPNEGRVEVFFNNQWGTVCYHGWDNQDAKAESFAKVICRQLVYPEGNYQAVIPIYDGYYAPGTGPIWLDDVNCTGIENDITECSHSGWGYHDCSHSEDVAIVCLTGTFMHKFNTSLYFPVNVSVR